MQSPIYALNKTCVEHLQRALRSTLPHSLADYIKAISGLEMWPPVSQGEWVDVHCLCRLWKALQKEWEPWSSTFWRTYGAENCGFDCPWFYIYWGSENSSPADKEAPSIYLGSFFIQEATSERCEWTSTQQKKKIIFFCSCSKEYNLQGKKMRIPSVEGLIWMYGLRGRMYLCYFPMDLSL